MSSKFEAPKICLKSTSARLDSLERMRVRQYKLAGLGWEDIAASMRINGAAKRAELKREYFK